MLQSITDSTCPAHSAAGVRGLSCRLLGLCTLSCRAFSYSMTQRHNSTLRLNASSLDLSLIHFSYTLRASLYLYNPMVHGPWVDLSSRHYITKMRDDNPLTHLQSSRSVPTHRGVFTLDLVKTWALSSKTFLGGSHAQNLSRIKEYLYIKPSTSRKC